MIWDYPVVITIKDRKRTFHIRTDKNLLPKKNEHWYTVNVTEFNSEHMPVAEFNFLHNIDTMRTEVAADHNIMPLKQICEEMHRKVKEGIESW